MPSDVIPPKERPVILPKGEGLEFTWAGMGWKARVDHFNESHKEIYAEVTYYQGTDGSSTLIAGPLDLNLKSHRVGAEQRNLILDRCENLSDVEKTVVKKDLDVMIGQIQSEAVRWYRSPPQHFGLDEVEVEEGHPEYLIPKLILKNAINTIVADGGGGKSYLALGIAVALATGEYQIPLLNPLEKGPVLYLDFEWNKEAHARRLWQITRGLGLPSRPAGIRHLRFTRPLAKIQGMHEIIQDVKPILIIVDSLGYALGGDAKEQDLVSSLYQTVLDWGVTALVIHHTNREKEYFGSIYIRNSTRTLWLMDSSKVAGGRRLTLRNDKASSGPEGEWMALRLGWTDDARRVNFYELDYSTENKKRPAQRIREYFSTHSEATASDVARACDVSKTTASNLFDTTEYELARETGTRKYYRLAGTGDRPVSSSPSSSPSSNLIVQSEMELDDQLDDRE